MLTVYILASSREKGFVESFWKHLAVLRRQSRHIAWASPLYVEDVAKTDALVPAVPQPYVVIGCLSSQFVSVLLDQPALGEMVSGALVSAPFIISRCSWDEWPSPFTGKQPLIPQPLVEVGQSDRAFADAVARVREMFVRVLGE